VASARLWQVLRRMRRRTCRQARLAIRSGGSARGQAITASSLSSSRFTPMVPPRRWLARTLTILALVSAVGVFAIALPGCGSSDDATSSDPTVSDGGTAAASDPPASDTERQGKAKPGEQGKGADQAGSKKSAQEKAGESAPPEERGQSKQRGGRQGSTKGSVCPSGMTRAECKARIEAETAGTQTPGEVVSPSNCTDVMPKRQCEEIIRAQKEAEKNAGKSVSPETCLDEYSREFCEERFGEQAEQQAGQ
jgi:hypothetical protein